MKKKKLKREFNVEIKIMKKTQYKKEAESEKLAILL